MKIEQDSAQVRLPPPLLYLGALLAGLAGDWLLAIPRLGFDRQPRLLIGAAMVIIGAATVLMATGLFRRRGTNVKPWQPSTQLVTDGIYGWTRNPMYLGATLVYAGLALDFDSLTALLLLPIVLFVIQTQVIAKEERYLEAKFGEPYGAYTARVRRWI